MKINYKRLIISLALPQLAGIIGSTSLTTGGSLNAWYAGLVKPALNPPAWVFGPAWTTLYALMGISLFLIWSSYAKATEDKKKQIKIALGIFGIQLFLNAIWSIIFFGLKNPGWALIFYKISKPTAYLLVPYLLWVSFASYLNYSIWVLN